VAQGDVDDADPAAPVAGTAGGDSRRSLAMRSLRERNFRLYFGGQLASTCGTWTQTVALAWLVLELTDSGASVGLLTACQFLPVLLLGAWGGVVADRFDNRRAVLAVQSLLGVQAAALAVVVFAHVDHLGVLYALAAVQGVGTALDTPTRQSLVGQLVPNEDLPNALALNAGLLQLARIAGPALAAGLIHVAGTGVCFAVNAASYAIVVGAVVALDPSRFVPRPGGAGGPPRVRDGLRYAWSAAELRDLLALTLLSSAVGVCSTVVLPLLAKDTYGGGSGLYGVLAAVMGVGALGGAIGVAARKALSKGQIVTTIAVTGLGMGALGLCAWPWLALVPLLVAGYASLSVGVVLNAALQVGARPDMRGRIIALYFLLAYGCNVVAAPLFGALSDALSPRWAFAAAGALALAGAAVLLVRWRSELAAPPVDPGLALVLAPATAAT
jgi:MFS family permease